MSRGLAPFNLGTDLTTVSCTPGLINDEPVARGRARTRTEGSEKEKRREGAFGPSVPNSSEWTDKYWPAANSRNNNANRAFELSPYRLAEFKPLGEGDSAR